MKKVVLIAMMCAAALLSGCEKSETGGTSVPTSSTATGDISYAAMLPSIEDTFPDGRVDVIISDGGSSYCVQVTGYKDGEYEKYVEGCKAKGFTDVRFDINESNNSSFEARTEDGKYYVSLQLLKDERQVLTITCGARTNSSASSN